MPSAMLTTPDGKQIQMLPNEEIDRLLNDNDPASRKAIMEHMKALGKPVTELIKMKTEERKAFILESYAAMGGSPAKAKAKAAPVAARAAAKPATKTGSVTPISAAKKAAPAAVADDDDDDDGAVPTTTASTAGQEAAGVSVQELAQTVVAAVQEALQAEILELKSVIEDLKTQLCEVQKIGLDTHFMVRSALPTASGLSDDDIVDVGNANGVFGVCLVEMPEESTAGN